MVGLIVMAIPRIVVMSSALGAQRTTGSAKTNRDLIGDIRLAMERMVRELHQAGTTDELAAPTAASGPAAITLRADFDHDGPRDVDTADPAVLTYRHPPGTGRVTTSTTERHRRHHPILDDEVTSFARRAAQQPVQYRRNADDVATWAELGATTPPVGQPERDPRHSGTRAKRTHRRERLRPPRVAQPDLPHPGPLP